MTWEELLKYYGKYEELFFIKEHEIEMNPVQEILDAKDVVYKEVKFKIETIKTVARHLKALETVDNILKTYKRIKSKVKE